MEWKFARSLLYMEYIDDGGTLPPPVNVIGAPKAVFRAVFCRCDCGNDDEEEEVAEDKPTTNGVKRDRHAAAHESVPGPSSPITDGQSGVSITACALTRNVRYFTHFV